MAKKKKQGKSGPKSTPKVSESARIRINKLLCNFRSSADEVYTFAAKFSHEERALIHQQSRKMGLLSKSSGKGAQRRVSVYRRNKSNKMQEDEVENLGVVTFSEEARSVLTDLFIHYPPGDDEAVKQWLNKPSENSSSSRRMRDDIFRRPVMKKAEIKQKMKSLADRIEKTPRLKEISDKRSKLPIASFQDAITSTIAAHQVVLISGETGCGKTTQVPQYLLDYMWAKGETCKLVCTQPRRISATSVAERISQERGEDIGATVGYKIRLDSAGGRHSSVLFCTNGILLRVLVSGGLNRSQSESTNVTRKVISELTHIIVDEIHERDRYSDFMLAIIRDLLPEYPHLRLVLMSATIDAEKFSRYFGGCPIIKVPGFTYPVKPLYLEEVLSILKTPEKDHLNASTACSSEESNLSKESQVALDEAIELAVSSEEFDPLLELISLEGTSNVLNYQHSSTGVSPLMVFAGKGRVGDVCTFLSLGANCHLQARDGSNALDWAMRQDQAEVMEILKNHVDGGSSSSITEQQLVEKYMSSTNSAYVDVVLVEQLLRKICTESQEGAILVFLPGWEDINSTRQRLLANSFFKDTAKFLILALHSMIPSTEQKQVFKRPPPGCRKIILSTNLAETSVTIDDVVYVIDSGRMKEKNYDPYTNVSTLQSSWVSQANAKQREGRAGRCQPGVCYHLYSRLRAASFPEFRTPEMMRMPIDELCLQVKMLDPNCKVEEFLNKTLDPPVHETIRNAITALQEIGAFTHDERLTELGEKLGSLPVHPATSKMLFFAILVNCLDPALTLACASEFKDPFILPMLPDERKKADDAKAELASLYGGNSDQLAVLAAFDCWRTAKEKGLAGQFCKDYFISPSTMRMLSGMRKQLQAELVRCGFIPGDVSCCSMNALDPGIVRAVIVAGLYPMVGKLHPPRNGKRMTVETASGDKVSLTGRSVNSKLVFKSFADRPLLVYDEVTRGDYGLLTRNTTLIGPLSLLLVAAEIVVTPGKGKDDEANDEGDDSGHDEGSDDEMEDADKTNKQEDAIMSSPDNAVTIVVDRWLRFGSTALDVAQIYCLRERLQAAILFKITNPRGVLPPVLGASVYATVCLLAYDGLNNPEIGKEKKGNPPSDFLQSLFTHLKIRPDLNKKEGGKLSKKEAGRQKQLARPGVPPPSQAVPMVVEPPVVSDHSLQGSLCKNAAHQLRLPLRVSGKVSKREARRQKQLARTGVLPPSQAVPVVVEPPVVVDHSSQKSQSKKAARLRRLLARHNVLPSQALPMVVEPPSQTPPRPTLEPGLGSSLSGHRQQQYAQVSVPPFQALPMVVEPPAQTPPQPTLKPALGSSLSGHRLNLFGPYGPRGDSSKRPRGN